jgi:hypothetical protein
MDSISLEKLQKEKIRVRPPALQNSCNKHKSILEPNARHVEFRKFAKVVVLDAATKVINVGEVAHGQVVFSLHRAEDLAHVVKDPLLFAAGGNGTG